MTSGVASSVRSLGYRTDLAVLDGQGSQIVRRPTYWVVRTPANPGYHWGNFVLVDPTRCATNPQVWLAQFEAEFPASEHVSIGLDRPDDHGLPPPDALAAARLECSTDTVLTAGALQVPRHVNDRAVCRPIGDNDWAAVLALRMRVDSDGPPTPAMRVFLTRAVSAERQATCAGGAIWFGGFVDGVLLSSLGVVATGGGVARYQNVVTDPSARRQGLAGMLVHRAGWFALRQWGVRRLVIVAEPDSDAIRLYRALGFVDAERQIALERAHAGDRRSVMWPPLDPRMGVPDEPIS